MSYNKGNNASIPEELRAGFGLNVNKEAIYNEAKRKRENEEPALSLNIHYSSADMFRFGVLRGVDGPQLEYFKTLDQDGWNDLFEEYKKTNASLYEEEKSCVEPEYPEPPEESTEEQDDFTVSIEKPSWSVDLEPYTEPYHETENKGDIRWRIWRTWNFQNRNGSQKI